MFNYKQYQSQSFKHSAYSSLAGLLIIMTLSACDQKPSTDHIDYNPTAPIEKGGTMIDALSG